MAALPGIITTSFSIRYFVEDSVIYLDKRFLIEFRFLEKEDFNEWNKMIDLLNKAYRETLVFEKTEN